MPALNFQKQFAPKVEARLKRQTIRALRKRPIKKGDMLYLYTGMRTKACRRLIEPTPCVEVYNFSISPSFRWGVVCHLDGAPIPKWEVEELAEADGFASLEDFIFFSSQLTGYLSTGRLFTGKESHVH